MTDVSRPEVQLAAERNLEHDERPAADAEHTPAATSKAAALLSHNPEHTNREGVSAFVDWCRKNRDRYEPLVWAS